MGETLKNPEISAEALRHYNLAQLHVIKYMLLRGLITNELEYGDSAEIFSMMANRVLTIPASFDWQALRAEIEKITTPINQQLKIVSNI